MSILQRLRMSGHWALRTWRPALEGVDPDVIQAPKL
jgi:hypothetical protein